MILFSLNIRGVGGPHKMPSLRRLLDINKLDIIFLQETLVDEEKARKFIFSLCPSWMVCSLSSVGKSGGLLVAWNPYIFDLEEFMCVGGILLTGYHLPNNKKLSLINSYGPCSERRAFWNRVQAN
jgi:hypothetical protein